MKFTLKVWRQKSRGDQGFFEEHQVDDISNGTSFLEMLDLVNENIIATGGDPIAFEHDCREGICGACSMMINGYAHGPGKGSTTCQLHMHHFTDGDTIVIEPWRADPFPIEKDLVCDRTAFEHIIQSGGFITARTGSATEANEIRISKDTLEDAMDAAACIGCGACVAACKNASAMLFTGAKVAHLNRLPQGKAEKDRRVLSMVATMDDAGFGNCSNYGECSAVCPKEISLDVIAQLNRDYATAKIKNLFA